MQKARWKRPGVPRATDGFTVIELLIVIAILGILASLAVAAYQTYTVRAQVTESIGFAAAAKTAVEDAFGDTGAPPVGRAEAGMSPEPADSSSTFVRQLDIVNGRVDIVFGNEAHQDIVAQLLPMTPYIDPDGSISWRCGHAPAPSGAAPLSGGGITAEHREPTVDPRYLPRECR